MNTISWLPVVLADVCGAAITLVLALLCMKQALEWSRGKPHDFFVRYMLYLTFAIVVFAVSRSFGHIVKQVLLFSGKDAVWKLISPYSGALNTATFVVIFGLSVSFQRFRAMNLELKAHRDSLQLQLEERTRELSDANRDL